MAPFLHLHSDLRNVDGERKVFYQLVDESSYNLWRIEAARGHPSPTPEAVLYDLNVIISSVDSQQCPDSHIELFIRQRLFNGDFGRGVRRRFTLLSPLSHLAGVTLSRRNSLISISTFGVIVEIVRIAENRLESHERVDLRIWPLPPRSPLVQHDTGLFVVQHPTNFRLLRVNINHRSNYTPIRYGPSTFLLDVRAHWLQTEPSTLGRRPPPHFGVWSSCAVVTTWSLATLTTCHYCKR